MGTGQCQVASFALFNAILREYLQAYNYFEVCSMHLVRTTVGTFCL